VGPVEEADAAERGPTIESVRQLCASGHPCEAGLTPSPPVSFPLVVRVCL
jgi:hypothetical protein